MLFHTLHPGCILQYDHTYFPCVTLKNAWGGSMAGGREEISNIFWIGEDMVKEVVGLFRGPPLDQLPSEEE
jgi:hypothetical protein